MLRGSLIKGDYVLLISQLTSPCQREHPPPAPGPASPTPTHTHLHTANIPKPQLEKKTLGKRKFQETLESRIFSSVCAFFFFFINPQTVTSERIIEEQLEEGKANRVQSWQALDLRPCSRGIRPDLQFSTSAAEKQLCIIHTANY